MARRRWIMLVAPPLLAAAATAPVLGWGSAPRAEAAAVPAPPGEPGLPARGQVTTCPAVRDGASPDPAAFAPGAWWRIEPVLDDAGSLEAWNLWVGAPRAAESDRRIPAASTVSGPSGGRVVVASEPDSLETRSVIRIVDALTGCAAEIGLGDRIARRAVMDPIGDGVLAHLLEPGSRRDLGVWRVSLDGGIDERVVEPVPDALLASAGMDRVWATDLRLDAAGRRLAVQSCHPEACFTRVVDLSTGALDVLADELQGPVIGFSGRSLITWAACHGLPCPVVEWNESGGPSRALAPDASQAALSGDGRRLVVVRGMELVAVDVSSGAARTLGPVDPDAILLSGAAGGTSAMEVAGADVAIGHAGGGRAPQTLPESAAALLPDREVKP